MCSIIGLINRLYHCGLFKNKVSEKAIIRGCELKSVGIKKTRDRKDRAEGKEEGDREKKEYKERTVWDNRKV